MEDVAPFGQDSHKIKPEQGIRGYFEAKGRQRLHQEDAYSQFMHLDTDTFGFEINRQQVSEDMTFSKEALDRVADSMFLFVGARIIARWEKTGTPPQSIRAIVTLEWD